MGICDSTRHLPLPQRIAGRAEQVIDVSVRRSGEESGTHRTHGTVADGTKGHKRQKDTLADLYMLRRCVGFSWAKPCVTKSSTHPSVLSVKITLAVLRVAPFLSILSISQHFVLGRISSGFSLYAGRK